MKKYYKGIIDLEETKNHLALSRWKSMMDRCYSSRVHKKYPTYVGCTVCEEWLTYSKFKQWFDTNYVDGWYLDKDLVVKGNKIYSPETCIFIPHHLNCLFNNNRPRRKLDLPIGVGIQRKKYRAQLNMYGKNHTIGSFDTVEEAANAYAVARKKYINELLDNYKSDPRLSNLCSILENREL